jgi:hypothetical protein
MFFGAIQGASKDKTPRALVFKFSLIAHLTRVFRYLLNFLIVLTRRHLSSNSITFHYIVFLINYNTLYHHLQTETPFLLFDVVSLITLTYLWHAWCASYQCLHFCADFLSSRHISKKTSTASHLQPSHYLTLLLTLRAYYLQKLAIVPFFLN